MDAGTHPPSSRLIRRHHEAVENLLDARLLELDLQLVALRSPDTSIAELLVEDTCATSELLVRPPARRYLEGAALDHRSRSLTLRPGFEPASAEAAETSSETASPEAAETLLLRRRRQ